MSEEFFDVTRYERYIADSDVLRRLLRDRKFIAEQISKVMTMYNGEVSPLTLIRGLEYRLEENQEISEAIERFRLQTIRRKCLLHYYAIYVFAMAHELKIMEEFGRKHE